jgi:hypothetical protein
MGGQQVHRRELDYIKQYKTASDDKMKLYRGSSEH